MRWRWWKAGVVVIALAVLGLALFNVYKVEERRNKIAAIQTGIDFVRTRAADLKARFDQLNAESAAAPNDPERLRVLGARHLGLVKEDQALKKDLARLQHDLDEVKR